MGPGEGLGRGDGAFGERWIEEILFTVPHFVGGIKTEGSKLEKAKDERGVGHQGDPRRCWSGRFAAGGQRGRHGDAKDAEAKHRQDNRGVGLIVALFLEIIRQPIATSKKIRYERSKQKGAPKGSGRKAVKDK